jgi:hypothetical protein
MPGIRGLPRVYRHRPARGQLAAVTPEGHEHATRLGWNAEREPMVAGPHRHRVRRDPITELEEVAADETAAGLPLSELEPPCVASARSRA